MKPYKVVELPHVRHEVKFFDMKYLVGVEHAGAAYTAVGDENTTFVFIKDIEENLKRLEFAPWVAHELVHVLQIICEKLHARFENEQEHMAYIMHYLFSKLLEPNK